MFRNLSIRSKLRWLLAVPVATAALLALAGVAGGLAERGRADQERHMAAVAGRAGTAVHELQEERVRAAAWVAAAEGGRGGAELRARRRQVDRALAAYRAGLAGLGRTGDPALDRAIGVATERLERLATVRAEADRRLVTPARTVADHDLMVRALRGVEGGLAGSLTTPEPARVARLLVALTAAKEATAQERALLAATPADRTGAGTRVATPADRTGAGSAPGPAGATGAGALPARLSAAAAVARYGLEGVRAVAGDRLAAVDAALAVPGAHEAARLELALLDAASSPGPGLQAGKLAPWREGLAARARALRRVEQAVAGDLAEAAGVALAGRERGLRARLALLAAAGAALMAAVQLLRPAPGGHPPPDPPGGTVLGLARRGQALLERQLHLVDELGRDEPAPGRRQGLVLLDHLTTRLRRNAETLLAVAGPGPVGRWDRPVPVATLLRAAVAELHEFPEVELVAVDEAEVAGPAAADLVHLLAELLDNAVAFSPPAEPVALTGAGDADGYLIQIADRGLGMTDAELAWANRRLAGGPDGAGPDPDGRPGDRLGLALAGRLAARHGLGVQLGRSPAGGVAAAVRLPASLLSARTPTPVEHA